MTNDAIVHSQSPRSGILRIAATFVLLVALTIAELIVIGLDAERATRVTTLAGLLMVKVGAVMAFFMHARANRRAAWFALVAITFAAGAGVVLLLETAYRVRGS
jgi:heme/copper-type cytochrome/quinol oxidase subunit 4